VIDGVVCVCGMVLVLFVYVVCSVLVVVVCCVIIAVVM